MTLVRRCIRIRRTNARIHVNRLKHSVGGSGGNMESGGSGGVSGMGGASGMGGVTGEAGSGGEAGAVGSAGQSGAPFGVCPTEVSFVGQVQGARAEIPNGGSPIFEPWDTSYQAGIGAVIAAIPEEAILDDEATLDVNEGRIGVTTRLESRRQRSSRPLTGVPLTLLCHKPTSGSAMQTVPWNSTSTTQIQRLSPHLTSRWDRRSHSWRRE